MMDPEQVIQLLDEFRASRREFVRRLLPLPPDRRTTPPAPGEWSARDLIAHVAAWIERANDHIPRLLLGWTPGEQIDVDTFNAEAVASASGWTAEQALAAFRRAADRFEAIVGETDPCDIADSDEAVALLASIASELMNEHFDDIDRLVAALR